MKRIRLGVLAAVLLSCTAAMAAGKNAGTKDIVDTAVAAGSFQTLAKALQAADLVDTLKGAQARSPSSRRRTKPSPSCRRARWRTC